MMGRPRPEVNSGTRFGPKSSLAPWQISPDHCIKLGQRMVIGLDIACRQLSRVLPGQYRPTGVPSLRAHEFAMFVTALGAQDTVGVVGAQHAMEDVFEVGRFELTP